MSHSALKLNYHPQTGFRLTVKVVFNQQAIQHSIKEKSYKSIISEGIEQNWSGTYLMEEELKSACEEFFLKENITTGLSHNHFEKLPFKVEIIEDELSGKHRPRKLFLLRLIQRKVRPIPIFLKKPRILPSHVASGILRRFWGIFRTGQIESIGYNWSRSFPGFAVIIKSGNEHHMRQISAHEAGHLFGVGDAYAAWYRFFYAAPGTENYMMHYNKQVQPTEVAMLIRAYTRKRAQFFPRKFILKKFAIGMIAELKYYFKKIIRLFLPKKKT